MSIFAKAFSVIMCVAIILCTVFCVSQITVLADSSIIGYIDGVDVNLRSNAGTNYPSLGKLGKVSVQVLDLKLDNSGYTWYKIKTDSVEGYMRSDFIKILSADAADAEFEQKISVFPESYKTGLRVLHKFYPNWSFEADILPSSFYDVVAAQGTGNRKQVNMTSDGASWRSMTPEYYNWADASWKPTNGGWIGASFEVIEFYLDVRNFFNPNDAYMFMKQSYDENTQTEDGVKKIIAGTFLENGYSDPDDTAYGGSYSKVIMEAARQSGVNPYVIASTIILEQSTEGKSSLISGTTSYGKYYNFFNFDAWGNTSEEVVAKGLNYAKDKGWSTRSASIIGGAIKYAEGYINIGQNTYYYKDFNVVLGNYNHQYAQSVYDAKSSATRLREVYSADRELDLTFRIPVYQNMPSSPINKPISDDKLNNYYILELASSSGSFNPTFSMTTKNYSININGDTVFSVKLPSGASIASPTEFSLNAGNNNLELSVKSQSGYINNYSFSVTAPSASKLSITTGNLPASPGEPENTVVCGDTNGDGKVTIIDLANVQKHLLNIINLSASNSSGADTNKDGKITIIDLANIQKHLLNLIILK